MNEEKAMHEKTMNNKMNARIALVLNIIVVLMEIYATGQSCIKQGLQMFCFYTVDSNIIALISSIWYVMCYRRDKNQPLSYSRYLAIVNLSLTFIIVVFVLCPVSGGLMGPMFQEERLYHHLLCPVLSAISFFFFEHDISLEKTYWIRLLFPTVLYAAVILALNIAKVMEGPYPFLHVYEQPVYVTIIWIAVIMGLSLALIWGIGRLKQQYNEFRNRK